MVHYRGSTGRGKVFEDADKLQWDAGIQNDIKAFKDVVLAKYALDGTHTAAMGSSFGGYLALRAMQKNEDISCGVVDSSFVDLEAFAADAVGQFGSASDLIDRAGDPRTVTGRQTLQDMSPASYTDLFRNRGLLHFHGDHDEIVPVQSLSGFKKRMLIEDHQYTFVENPNWGHGLSSSEGQITYHAMAESLLAKCFNTPMQPFTAAEEYILRLNTVEGNRLPTR